MRIPVSQFQAGLSKYLEAASEGNEIILTSGDRVIARVSAVPIEEEPNGLQSLLASGAAEWNGKKPDFRTPLVLTTGGTTLSDIVIQDRG
jgi:antitoxin (DNA-binding transcriptional repressor) of toxin-antitoxin stability system